MVGYHCTTEKKLGQYVKTGAILPPVRFWKYPDSAAQWCKRTSRNIILKINTETEHPLPDHKPNGHAYWTPEVIREWVLMPNKEAK